MPDPFMLAVVGDDTMVLDRDARKLAHHGY
jgi:hypothetical protein